MEPLVLEYVLTGPERGYRFTSPTRGYDDATLKAVWRTAMPRGQGWGQHIGARSFKCFPLDERRVALSSVTVTDQQDESGRKGIRRAVIQVMTHEACAQHLRGIMSAYPHDVQRQIEHLPNAQEWDRLLRRVLPVLGRHEDQLILAGDYANWQVMEGVVMRLALALQGAWRRTIHVIPFTTLALDAREEMALVALPAASLKPDVDMGRVLRL